jgi:hypothetical protein
MKTMSLRAKRSNLVLLAGSFSRPNEIASLRSQ